MKNIRLLTVIFTALYLFTIAAGAVTFTPSIERKEGPELVEEVNPANSLLVTSVSALHDDEEDVHEVIESVLTKVSDELKKTTYEKLIPDFDKVWKESTGGAPIEHAVVSDVFDVRFEKSLADKEAKSEKITFKIKIQGLDKDDKFILIARKDGAENWKVVKEQKTAVALSKYLYGGKLTQSAAVCAAFETPVFTALSSANGGTDNAPAANFAAGTETEMNYTMGDDGILTITADTMSVFAIIRDNGAAPAVDPAGPTSPQTAVSQWYIPAIVGAVIFAAAAFVSARKLSKRTSN